MYYGLSNFYQNHRRYVKSRDDSQLNGDERSLKVLYLSVCLSKNKINNFCLINILSLKCVNIIKHILKCRNKIFLISKDSESIEGHPIIIEYRFTVVTTNYILLYDMINIMFLNIIVSF